MPAWVYVVSMFVTAALGFAGHWFANRTTQGLVPLHRAQTENTDAQTDKTKAETIDALFERIKKMEGEIEEARAHRDQQDTLIRTLQDEQRKNRDYMDAFRRSAAQHGLKISTTGKIIVRREVVILVVDDDEDCRDMYTAWLEDDGYEVYSCVSAAEAAAIVQKREPSTAIVDMYLTDHETAVDVANAIRAVPGMEHLPIILVTGLMDDPTDMRIAQVRPVRTVRKAPDMEELMQIVHSAVAANDAPPIA